MKKKFLGLGLCLVSAFVLASCTPTNSGKGTVMPTESTKESTGQKEHVHKYKHKDAKESTYIKKGNIEYYTCSGCGKYFDAEKNEIDENTIYLDYLTMEGKITGFDDDGNAITNIKKETLKGAYAYEISLVAKINDNDVNLTYVHWTEELKDGDLGLLTDKGDYAVFEVGNESFKEKFSANVDDTFAIKFVSPTRYNSKINFFNVTDGGSSVAVFGEDVTVSYKTGTQDTYTAYGEAVIEAAKKEEISYAQLKELYDDFVSQYYYLIDEYHYAAITADTSVKDSDYDLKNEIYELVNSFEEIDQRIDLAVYDTKYKKEFFAESGYTTDQEIDKYIATIDVDATAAANKLSVEMEKYLTDYAAEGSTVTAGETLFKYYSKSQEYATLMGYNDYLEYAYENVYGREYTVAESNNLKPFISTYIVPFCSSYSDEFYDAYDKAGTNERVREAFNTSINLLYNYYGGYFDLLNDYSTLIGGDYYDSFKNLYVSGKYYYSSNKNDSITAYVSHYSDGTPFMFMSPGYQGLSTFIHEFGHYNAAMVGGDNISYDLDEVQSQANETLFALYLQNSGIKSETILKLYLDAVIFQMADSVINGYLVNELEKWVYTLDYTTFTDGGTATLKDYNIIHKKELDEKGYPDGLSQAQFDALDASKKALTKYDNFALAYHAKWNEICQGINATDKKDLGNLDMILTSYQGYYISYATSAVAALEVYATAYDELKETGKMDNAIAIYKEIYKKHDEENDTFESVLVDAGVYGVFDENAYKLIATAKNPKA